MRRASNTTRGVHTLESNEKKLKAFSVNRGVANVPRYILDAQGGHILGFKCVSAFVGPDTVEGTAWKIDMLTKTLAHRGAEQHPHRRRR